MSNYKYVLSDFILFVKRPNKIRSKLSSVKKSSLLIALFLFAFLLSIVSGGISKLTVNYFEINRIPSYISNTNVYITFFISAVIVGPLIEEIAYRLPLRVSKQYSALGFSALIFIWVSKLYYRTMVFSSEGLISKITLALLGGLIVFFILRNTKTLHRLELFWKNNLRTVVYFSVVLFGYMHLFNFEITKWTILFSPLLVLPQIIMGFVFTYARLKFGFIYAIVTHALLNLIGFVMISGG